MMLNMGAIALLLLATQGTYATPVPAPYQSGSSESGSTNHQGLERRLTWAPRCPPGMRKIYDKGDGSAMCLDLYIYASGLGGFVTVVGGYALSVGASIFQGTVSTTVTATVGIPTAGEDGGDKKKVFLSAPPNGPPSTKRQIAQYADASNTTSSNATDLSMYGYTYSNDTSLYENSAYIAPLPNVTTSSNTTFNGTQGLTAHIKNEVRMHLKVRKGYKQSHAVVHVKESAEDIAHLMNTAMDYMTEYQLRCATFVMVDNQTLPMQWLLEIGVEDEDKKVWNGCWRV